MKKFFFLFFLVLVVWASASAQLKLSEIAKQDTAKRRMIVGIKMSPPFTMKDENGTITGVSVKLWERMAEKLNVNFVYKEYNLIDLLKAIKNGDVDLCISPLTVTSERIMDFDFTQPFYNSSFAIAIPGERKSALLLFLSNIFSVDFLKIIGLLFLVISSFGFLVWLVEKNHNYRFAKGAKGFGDGIWWAAVTMATVGYGDKVPSTKLGRTIATVWMFTSLIIISSFTASITTALTVNKIGVSIESVQDLRKTHKVASITGSSSEHYLVLNKVKAEGFSTVEDGLNALAAKKIDAFLYDYPIMEYIIREKDYSNQVQIVPNNFGSQYYSFSLPKKHPMYHAINTLLIQETEDINWKNILSEFNLIK